MTNLEAEQLARVRSLIKFLQNESQNGFYKEKLAGLNPDEIRTRADFSRLPFTSKAELVAEQSNFPPFGRNLSYPLTEYVKLHQTSGTTGHPLRVPDTAISWEWWANCWLKVYEAAQVSKQDRIFFAFSFGPFIGFWAAYEAASRLEALTLPGGGMDTEQRLAAILDLGATVICCTPSYALHLLEVAEQKGYNLPESAVRTLVLAGEPGGNIPATRQRIEQGWGAKCFDHAGATEVGAWGYSCVVQSGLHINEKEFLAEIVEPGKNTPVADGEPGELVITNLGRWGYPVIRYRTGDSVKVATQACSCGDTAPLLEGGVIGRVDSMVTVRGVNIYPSSVEAIVRELLPAAEYRIIFYRENNLDQMEIQLELAENQQEFREKLANLFKQRLALRVPVTPVALNTLPRFQLKARRVEDRRFDGV